MPCAGGTPPPCCEASVKRAAQLETLARNLASANQILIAEGAKRDAQQLAIDSAVAAVQARLADLTAASAATDAENVALRERLAHALRSSELLEKRAEAESQRSSIEAQLSAALRAESEALRAGYGSKLEALEGAFSKEVGALRLCGEQREGALEAALRESHAREERLRGQLEEFAPQLAALSEKFNETLEDRQREAERVRRQRPARLPMAAWRAHPPPPSCTPPPRPPTVECAVQGACRSAGGAAAQHRGGVENVAAGAHFGAA